MCVCAYLCVYVCICMFICVCAFVLTPQCICKCMQIIGLLGLLIWSLVIATPSEILDATARIAANSTGGAEDGGGAALRRLNGMTAAVAGW